MECEHENTLIDEDMLRNIFNLQTVINNHVTFLFESESPHQNEQAEFICDSVIKLNRDYYKKLIGLISAPVIEPKNKSVVKK